MTVDDMPCQELVELISDYLEGVMGAADRVRFEAHLAECPPCREYLAQFQAVIAASGRLAAEDIPDDVRASLVEAFRAITGEL